MKAIGSNHIQMHAEVNLPRTIYACFWSTAIPQQLLLAHALWHPKHGSQMPLDKGTLEQLGKSHFFMNWPFTTIHRWGELGANCPSPARTPISVTLWSHLWNLRKDPVRDERVRLYDERRWFEKRTCFIAMIFGMHPFHVFNILFYLFWFVSDKFWQISSGMLSCGLQCKLQKLCFSRTRGSSPHGTRRQRRQERWPKKRREQKRLQAFLEAGPSYEIPFCAY